ncbi:MAG: glycosyltransferase [Crenarchaeota archaeon]|nr:glycosyltransferase [Thermoproteota archaeon]MDA1124777.1 glycosyltransferase [Thermoproteota archaeon]
MAKIGQFIYPWGNGHYSRMMRLNEKLKEMGYNEFHYFSKGDIYEKLLEKFPNEKENIHEVLMPTPIDGKFGPNLAKSMLNFLLPVEDNKPLVTQISSYLKDEGKLYNKIGFDLVINDGDMGSNVLAQRRNITSLFVTNQFKPKLWKSRFYFKPALEFVAKQISKASKILVADTEPPYTICEYNLNFTKEVQEKIIYVGHFMNKKKSEKIEKSDLEKLVSDSVYSYWMRTGNKSTNDGTGERYEEAFHQSEMKDEKRIISHARNNPNIDRVLDKNGKKYSISEAYEKKIDWVQIDKGFLSEQEKETVLNLCKYAVVNGSHTVMGEILGGHAKPIIGIPIYDEHTNQIEWAKEKKLGLFARNRVQIVKAIREMHENYEEITDSVKEFSRNFNGNGVSNTAKIVSEILEDKK